LIKKQNANMEAYLSPTSLYILRMRSSSCSLMCITSHSLLLTSASFVTLYQKL